MKNKKFKIICCFLAPILFLVLSTIYKVESIPTTIFLRNNEEVASNSILSLQKNKLKLLGVLPVKSVDVKEVPNETMVYPGGQPIGVKLSTKGVLVVGLSDVDTGKGIATSPAAVGGIQVGDNIIKINDKLINSSECVSDIVNQSNGNNVKILIVRKGTESTKIIKPVKVSLNSYKLGVWIRDSTAGIGTLTFYDSNSNIFGALGHPITDMDTNTILSVNKGEIVSSNVVSIRKGSRGNPGELKGAFVNEDNPLGAIQRNTECGIFGSGNEIKNIHFGKAMKVALRNEIHEGPAKIITTIDGDIPKEYEIVIEKLLQQEKPGPKSMVIKVTDPILLEKTGGIVQGMSGSPIIQNGKLVGAVTHVLINKPDTGYGIYIEWMLKDSNILENNH